MWLGDSLGAGAESAFRDSWTQERLTLHMGSNSVANGLARDDGLEPSVSEGLKDASGPALGEVTVWRMTSAVQDGLCVCMWEWWW